MKAYVMGRYVEEEALERAMETAYEGLPERDQFTIEAAIEDAIRAHRGDFARGVGELTLWEFFAKLGLYLADHPEVQARFDGHGLFETFVRVKPTDQREKIRSFLL